MAKSVILKCDLCGQWDSEDNKVQTVGVAGPRFDLCASDRIQIIGRMGVEFEKAVKFVAAFDKRVSLRGAPPSVSFADKAPADLQEPADKSLATDEPELPLVDGEAEQAETEAKPSGRRAAKR